MSNYNNIVIIGATGLVGIEFVKLLKIRILLNHTITIKLISNNSVGKTCPYLGLVYESMNSIDYTIPSIFINCAGSEQASIVASSMQSYSILIDNSSEFRMDPKVPLIIPEINWSDYIKSNSTIIANPNCSTIIMAMLLNPFLKNQFKIKRIVVSTYQAASGAGKEGLEELEKQTQDIVNKNKLTTNYWKKQYIHNLFVHNSPIEENKYCQEENKLINETNKIFKTNIGISPTCIRVPVLRSHCESVNIEFDNEISFEQVMSLLKEEKTTLEIINDMHNHIFPTALSTNLSTLVQVGHIRPDYSLDKNKGWNFWISGDQLLRGAAYNAYVIMEKLLINN